MHNSLAGKLPVTANLFIMNVILMVEISSGLLVIAGNYSYSRGAYSVPIMGVEKREKVLPTSTMQYGTAAEVENSTPSFLQRVKVH